MLHEKTFSSCKRKKEEQKKRYRVFINGWCKSNYINNYINVNELSNPTKRQGLSYWIKKNHPTIYMLAVGNIYSIQRSNRLEIKKWKEIYYAYSNCTKVEMAMLISDKIALRFFTKHRGTVSNDMNVNPSGSYNNYAHVCT